MSRVQMAPVAVMWETADGVITDIYEHGWQAKKAISACVDNLLAGEKLTVRVMSEQWK